MGKWQRFHSTYSSINISSPDTGAANVHLDWFREQAQMRADDPKKNRIMINGISLWEYAKKYNSFERAHRC